MVPIFSPPPPNVTNAFSKSDVSRNQAEPKTEEAVAIAWRVAASIRHATTLSVEVPTTTPKHAFRSIFRTLRVRLRIEAIAAIQILAPFPHIAAHIVQTEGVGLFGAHSAWGAAAVVVVPADDGESVAAAVQERRVAEVLATAGGVFPFRLGGQTVVHSGLLVELEEENLHLVPGNILHGQVIAHHAARVGAHNLLPQLLGDFIFGDGETL